MANTEVLHELIRVLHQIKRENLAFHQGSWATGPITENLCGTYMCLLGRAAMDPYFREKGLALLVKIVRHEPYRNYLFSDVSKWMPIEEAPVGSRINFSTVTSKWDDLEGNHNINPFAVAVELLEIPMEFARPIFGSHPMSIDQKIEQIKQSIVEMETQ